MSAWAPAAACVVLLLWCWLLHRSAGRRRAQAERLLAIAQAEHRAAANIYDQIRTEGRR
jgi:hypothetical protein